jgi:2-oxoglutarate ferredoxin oxidoreductase subunit gamma
LRTLSIRISGFGGQGIILAAVILGTAMVKKGNLYAVQTQSYGSEARGGECQSELIVSDKPINSPTTRDKDILICLFQSALDKYLSTLKKTGILIVDPKLVTEIPPIEANIYRVPATETAIKIGNRIAANMVILGFLQKLIKVVNEDNLREIISSMVPKKFIDINLKAFNAGVNFAKDLDAKMEDIG